MNIKVRAQALHLNFKRFKKWSQTNLGCEQLNL